MKSIRDLLKDRPIVTQDNPPKVPIKYPNATFKRSTCHPDIRHYARGLCEYCYKHQHYKGSLELFPVTKEIEIATCHPDRRHHANKLCKPCYYSQGEALLNRRENTWRNNGIKNFTIKDYEKLFNEQKGVCAICSDSPGAKALAVDHDHVTGKIRGLLCHSCNLNLMKKKHTVEILAKAIAYLKANE